MRRGLGASRPVSEEADNLKGGERPSSWLRWRSRRTQSQRSHGKDRAKREGFAAGAEGNRRDRLRFTWRGCVLAKAAGLNKSST